MISELYVIMDVVAEECGPVFEAKSESVAQRNFVNLLKKCPSPGDFVLRRVGTLDHDTCLLTACVPFVEVPVVVRGESDG